MTLNDGKKKQQKNKKTNQRAMSHALGLFAKVGERLILRILRQTAVRELLRLMETSKSMYAFANYNKIWKRICIKRWEGAGNAKFRAEWKMDFASSHRVCCVFSVCLRATRWEHCTLEHRPFRCCLFARF